MNLPDCPIEDVSPVPAGPVYVFVNDKWYKTVNFFADQPNWQEATEYEAGLVLQTELVRKGESATDTRKRVENAWQELKELNKKYFYFFTE